MNTGRKLRKKAPFGVRFEGGGATVTASAGAVLLLDLLSAKRVLPRPALLEEWRSQGWIEGQMLLTLVLLNLLGLDRVEDVEQLESDGGAVRAGAPL